MNIVTLEDIKRNSRIELDYTDEDNELTLYGNSAEESVVQMLNRGRNVAEAVASLTEDFGYVPENIRHAVLMLTDLSYKYRSPVAAQSLSLVPYSFDILLKPYIKL